MIHITEVCIFSIDKNEDSWAIEGEVFFEEGLSTAFDVTLVLEDSELEDLTLEIRPLDLDDAILKDMIISATMEYED